MSTHTAAVSNDADDADDEDELIRLAQAGDGAAFGRLYDRYLPSIYRYTYSRPRRAVRPRI